MLGLMADIQLNWRLRKLRKRKRKQPANWQAVEKIAVIINSANPVNKNEIDRQLHGLGKYAEVFFVETANKKPTYGDWTCFTREHVNVFGLPRKKVMENLQKQTFDMVINTSPYPDRFSAMVSACIPSSFNCVCNNDLRQADLNIVADSKEGAANLLSQAFYYLQMIRA